MGADDLHAAADPGDDGSHDPVVDLVRRARRLWAHQAGVPVAAFSSTGLDPVIAPRSAIAPPGWVGIVVVDGQSLTTVPDAATAASIREHLGGLDLAQVRDETHWYGWVGAHQHLGPAHLSYGTGADVISRALPGQVELLPPGAEELTALLRRTDPSEGAESGMAEVTSRIAVAHGPTGVVAAAGYRRWAAGDESRVDELGDTGTGKAVAHLSVLTAAEVRGQHLAPLVAAAAAIEASRHGLLLQWRARPPASRRVAARIGLRELGWQLSLDCR
ncbi:GNAT family N-acetyltransferase [Quadrisphaera oryzae]|uniref:GNAT family N-acetyltransferase n=1 Tax=Quadrisphaera TaxID=317661 RepID=UPI001646F5F0|nr:GNAT family N-acetyltransferase [Quadrisphaera sp. RL12-1S]MBC3763454.1 GNAT family N-acetyltransferase [Quadrisphaera sp. RL12-1S]